ncbi:MAG: DUF4835 family protein [Gloeobacteraceae cyanobacterium ES-bin-316]|nr:DUF4835 family protein [Ferruginibacter sp.]
MNKFIFLVCFCLSGSFAGAQELNARVTVVANRVNNTVNKNTFLTLQTALNNFLNNRKWSAETYAANEKIDCNFLLNLEQTSETNVYAASLTIQAARPVLNTSYLSPIINFKDDNVLFKYVEFQILEFNENRVSGSDALVSNLTAAFAYYAHLIVAFDNVSFSQRGGDVHFLKAQNIVNNAPDGRGITGWKAFDGIRNRYWLVENMLNSRYNIMHDVYYNYYRLGMDKMYEDEKVARTELLNVLNLLSNFNNENPNTMINQFFFQGKSSELIKIFSKASPLEKARAAELLQKLDLTNAGTYKEQLK